MDLWIKLWLVSVCIVGFAGIGTIFYIAVWKL